jgi:hypothetical protein
MNQEEQPNACKTKRKKKEKEGITFSDHLKVFDRPIVEPWLAMVWSDDRA